MKETPTLVCIQPEDRLVIAAALQIAAVLSSPLNSRVLIRMIEAGLLDQATAKVIQSAMGALCSGRVSDWQDNTFTIARYSVLINPNGNDKAETLDKLNNVSKKIAAMLRGL